MNEQMPVKFSSCDCGVARNKNGSLVRIFDLVEHLEYVLDSDNHVRSRVEELMEYLNGGAR